MTRETAVRIARLSWIIPFGAMVANAVLGRPGGGQSPRSPSEQGQAVGQACVVFLAFVAGAVLAVIALRAVRRHEPAGIRLPAWIGLLLNVVLILAFVVVAILAVGQRT